MMFCPSVLKLLPGSTTSASRFISSHAAKRKYPWIIPEMASFGAPGISKTPRIVHDSFLAGGFGSQPLNLLYQVRNSIIFLPFPPSPRKIPFVPPYVVSFWFLKCGRACDRSLLNRSPLLLSAVQPSSKQSHVLTSRTHTDLVVDFRRLCTKTRAPIYFTTNLMEQVRYVSNSAMLQTTGGIVELNSDVNAELERVNNDIVALAEKIDKEKGALVQATGAGNLALQAIYQTSLDKLWEREAELRKLRTDLAGKLGSHSHGASSSSVHDRLPPLPL